MKPRVFTTLFLTTLLSGTVCLVPNSVLARGGGGGHSGGGHSGSGHGSSYSSGSHGGSVHIGGYTRSNGTYVRSYTRSAPGSDSKYSSSSSYSTGSEYNSDSEYSSSSNDSKPNSTTSDTFQDALDSAISATTIAQSAVSKDDWGLVGNKLQNSINLLKQVPASNPNYAEAQIKIQEYETNLNHVQEQLSLLPILQPAEVGTQTTFTSELQPTEESSVLIASDESATVSSHDSAVTAPVSPSPEVKPTASNASGEVKPESESKSNLLGAIILTMLVALGAIGFYKTKTTKSSNIKSAPVSESVPFIQTVPLQPNRHSSANSSPNYYIPKNYSVPNFEKTVGFLERTGSIALGLGALVAFGLLNQKMGGGFGGGSVRVSGYRKSNGTFVHSHTRHRPR